MKGAFLIVSLAISCALAQDVSSVEAKPTDCYESCIGFAEHLKSRKVEDPIDAAREYCSSAKIKCDDVSRFAKLTNVFVRAGLPMKRACQSKKFCPTSKRVEGGVACDTCLFVVDTVNKILATANATVDEIVNAVKLLCKQLSPLKVQSKICADVVDYIRKIVQYILEGMKPGDICIKLKLCNGTISTQQSEALKQVSELLPFVSRKLMESQEDLPYLMKRFSKLGMKGSNVKGGKSCAICKFVASIVTSSIQFSNSSVEIISQKITMLCNTRPEFEKEMCLAYVAKADQLASYIEQKLSPDDACKKLELCPARADNIFKGAKVLVANEKKPKRSNSKVSCRICKMVVDIVGFSIRFTNSTITAVEQTITMFCDMKPVAQKEQCLAYVKKVDLIVQYIERKLSPGVICVKLGICPNTRAGRRHIPLQMPSKQHQKKVKSICRACTKYENLIQKKLKVYKANSRGMRDVIAANCGNSATPIMQEKCLMIAPVLTITDGIVNNMLDEKVCRKTLCSNGFFVFSTVVARRKSGECNMCKYGLNFHLKKLQLSRQVFEQNVDTADSFCSNSKFKELSTECKLFVDRTEDLIEDIIKEVTSVEVCKRMELCKPKSKFSFASFWKSLSGDLSACGICKATVEAARKGASTEGADKSLSNACNTMKRFAGEKICKMVLEQRGGFAEISEKNKSPEEICQQLRLCGKARDFGEIISGVLKGFQNIFG